MSKELNVKGNEREILGKCFEFLHENEELYAEEFDSKHDEYRDIIQKEKTDYVSKKRNLLPIHKKLSKLDSNKTQMDYDATSLYPSAMWDENSLHPKIATGFAFKPNMNDVYVEAFNNKTFNQDGDESAISTIN